MQKRIISILKRALITIVGIILVIIIKAGDTLITILLRSVDGVVRFFSELSQGFIFLRPLLIPFVSLHNSLVSTDVVLPLFFVALLVIFVDSLFPGGVRLFHVVTFPGTIIHEWGHKKMGEQYGLEITNVVYFQIDNPLGFVEWRGRRTFWQRIGIYTAPLLFNTVVSIGVAIVGTIYATQLGQWGLIFVYWLAFSVGAHAFPSHGDIDNIWNPILNGWRNELKRLLAIPIVLVLKLMQILKVAYLEAIYGLFLILSGISIGQTLM